MKMAFVIYDGMTVLDFVGFYDAVTRMKTMGFKDDLSWDLCGVSDEVKDDRGIIIKTGKLSPNLSEYDLLFIPGGTGTRELQYDTEFNNWLKTGQDVEYKISVCTGSLLLGSAGFLSGKRATTHANAYDFLTPYCSEVVKDRIVMDGKVITGAGVATSVDLGLFICEVLGGKEAVQRIQKQMDYPYYKVETFNRYHI